MKKKEKVTKTTKKTKKDNKKQSKKLLYLTVFFATCDVLAIICFIIMYGPWNYVRNLYITTAMNTMTHQYLAKIFYDDETIEQIKNSNYFVTINESTNINDITIDTTEKVTYKDKYEEELLTRENEDDLYKVINLKVGNSNAHLVAIYEPEKVELIHTKKFNVGGYGERVITMCQRYEGIVCINGGGFIDNGMGSDIPEGYVIKDHEIIWTPTNQDPNTYRANIIGMTDDGILKLMSNTTGTEAINAGVKDGMVFGPFLIVNGTPLEIVGDPWGKSPRMAIAQRKDGVMMFLAIDGKNYIDGATLQDVIDVLIKYGAYNAANLDGGQSSTLVVENKLENNPPAEAKTTNGRYVVTGWGLIP